MVRRSGKQAFALLLLLHIPFPPSYPRRGQSRDRLSSRIRSIATVVYIFRAEIGFRNVLVLFFELESVRCVSILESEVPLLVFRIEDSILAATVHRELVVAEMDR